MTETVPVITAAELEIELRADDQVVVLDVRPTREVESWQLEAVRLELVSIPLADLQADPALADPLRGRPVRVICAAGNASRQAVRLLRARGVPALDVTGGMLAWSQLLVGEPIQAVDGVDVIQFRRESRGCLSYVIGHAGEAVVVDPAADPAPYLAQASALGTRITHVVDTHVHADHVSGARRLASATGAPYRVSSPAIARGVAGHVAPLDHGDSIDLAGLALQVIGLPGHTSDVIGLLVGKEMLIAGDSLFVDGVARPDLEQGSNPVAAARRLNRTIVERILPLGDHVLLLPCHYPGGRRHEPVSATLGDVRVALQPLLAATVETFATTITRDLPTRPANHERIVAMNLGTTLSDQESAARLEVGANACAADIGSVAYQT